MSHCLASWNQVVNLLEKDKFFNVTDILNAMGKTENEILTLFFNEYENNQNLLKECFRKHEELILADNNSLVYKGFEHLSSLEKENDIYIVSNCQSSYLKLFIRKYNQNNIFKNTFCLYNPYDSKQKNIKHILDNSDIDQSFYIGDTESDLTSCEGLDITFLYASYGHGNLVYKNDLSFNSLSNIIMYLKYL